MKTHHLIIFQIGADNFVLEIDRMVQILRYAKPRAIPNAPPFIEGIIIWENLVIPVINLQTRLYPGTAEPFPKPKVFIIRLDSLNIGFKVGNVFKLITVTEDQVLPPPPALAGMVVDYIKGVVQHEGNIYLFLDLEKTLTGQIKLPAVVRVPLNGSAGVCPLFLDLLVLNQEAGHVGQLHQEPPADLLRCLLFPETALPIFVRLKIPLQFLSEEVHVFQAVEPIHKLLEDRPFDQAGASRARWRCEVLSPVCQPDRGVGGTGQLLEGGDALNVVLPCLQQVQ